MRDTIEFEIRGLPVALVVTPARLVEVEARAGVFHLRHAFAAKIFSALGSVWAQRQMAKFGYHRALRMVGCRDGDLVQLPGGTVEWRFPDIEYERSTMPAGFGRWCSVADGVSGLRWITTNDPNTRRDDDGRSRRAGELAVQVKAILTS